MRLERVEVCFRGVGRTRRALADFQQGRCAAHGVRDVPIVYVLSNLQHIRLGWARELGALQ